MVRKPGRNATVFALCIAFLSKSALRIVLKLGLGRSRRSRAICSSSSTSEPTDVSTTSGSAIILLIACSSCSIKGCLLMARTYTRPQVLQCSELKLFHGAFGFPKLFCNFSNRFFFHETFEEDRALIDRQIVD